MVERGDSTSGYDIFLSHSSADKAWVRSLADALTADGLRTYLDERELRPSDNFVSGLSDAVRQSRFLVLVASPRAQASRWVEQEWTSFMAEHGPVGRIVVVTLEPVNLPAFLNNVHRLDATSHDVRRVARELMSVVGRAGDLREDDARLLFIGQELTVVLSVETDHLAITDPAGGKRTAPPPWKVDNRFGIALLGFNRMTREPVTSDAERVELVDYARTLGDILFGLLFPTDASRQQLSQIMTPGRSRPLVTLRSDDDVLLSLPWELLHDGEAFLVRDARIDLARSTLGVVGPGAVVQQPRDYFHLVVNVSAPEGSGLNYEGESYRITRALSEHCRLRPTELGTVDDFVETVRRETPTGIHFSGHGSPGHLDFENDEGRNDTIAIGDLMTRLRERLPDGEAPAFFYLASCHGNEPASPEQGRSGSESTAAALHRAGVPQVVGYYGPIADELSTRAEEALYAAIAEGYTTRYAVRQARSALARPFSDVRSQHREAAGAAAVGSHPFGWAQLVLYHRGPEHSLSRPVPRGAAHRLEAPLERTFAGTGRRKILSTGFIGRRRELHGIRRRLRRGDRVFVLQGLGGLGKTTLAFHLLPLLGAGEDDVCTLWCHETASESNPAEQLIAQLLAFCRERFGLDWETVVEQVDRAARDDSAQRFQMFLEALLENVERLVIYLDNLESLLVGPQDARSDTTDSFASWRGVALRQIWLTLLTVARESGKLHLVASCRNRNEDLQAATIPVSPLPSDALYRLMEWSPGLRRLAGPTRARLVDVLAGHPRAVEFADDLIGDSLRRWEDRHGLWRLPESPGPDDVQREWKQLIEPALPHVHDKLRDDILFEAIWERVLDDRSRRMLFRMTLMRRPWEWELIQCLGEADEPREASEATAERLRRTSLLEQVEVSVDVEGNRSETAVRYTLHPTTAQLITDRFRKDETLRHDTHRRLGDYLEARTRDSLSIETRLDAGHHLFEIGAYDRSYKLLAHASDWLQKHGRCREGLRLLEPFLTESVRPAMKPGLVGGLLANVGKAYLRLGQAEDSITYFEQALASARSLGNRGGETSDLGNLGNAYFQLGNADKAIVYYEQALAIARERGIRQLEGNLLGNLGNAHRDLGEFEKAIGYLEQALASSRALGDRRGEQSRLSNLGVLHVQMRQLEKAVEYCERALVISRAIGDRQNEGVVFSTLGDAYSILGQVEKAIQYFYRRLEIAREIGDRRGEATGLAHLAAVYANLGQFKKATDLYERSLTIAREIKHVGLIDDVSRALQALQWLAGTEADGRLLRVVKKWLWRVFR